MPCCKVQFVYKVMEYGLELARILAHLHALPMLLSVVIPTHNRSDILRRCLQALAAQNLPKNNFEVIVVDDGSKDDTRKTAQAFQKKFARFVYLHQKNQGQGIARNHGVQYAKGEIVVFIGDDIMALEDFLAEHLRFHLRHNLENEAVLGFTAWHPKNTISPFMNWLTNGSSVFGRFGGHQFAYEKLRGKKEADFNFFYTSNISLKRSLVDKYPFDPAFSGYGWEDIELGYRLYRREKLKIYYNAQAIGYHDHVMTEDSLAGRMRAIGKSAWIFQRKYPELKKVPSPGKHFVFWLLANPLALRFFSRTDRNLYYYALSKKYFLEGLKMGKSASQSMSFSI